MNSRGVQRACQSLGMNVGTFCGHLCRWFVNETCSWQAFCATGCSPCGGRRNQRSFHLAGQPKLSPYAHLQGHWRHPTPSSSSAKGPTPHRESTHALIPMHLYTHTHTHTHTLHVNIPLTPEQTAFTKHTCKLFSITFLCAQWQKKCVGTGVNTHTRIHASERILSWTRMRVDFRSRRFGPVASGEESCSLVADLTCELVSLWLREVLLIDDQGHPRVPPCMTSWNMLAIICKRRCVPTKCFDTRECWFRGTSKIINTRSCDLLPRSLKAGFYRLEARMCGLMIYCIGRRFVPISTMQVQHYRLQPL